MERSPRQPASLALDFSGAYPLMDCPWGCPEVARLDCRDIAGANCYCDDDAAAEILRRVEPYSGRAVHWIDGGDYHYLSHLFLGQYERTLGEGRTYTLLVLDHHPDMQRPLYGDILSCGGWVRSSLEASRALEKCVLVGVDDSLLLETEGFGSRVEVVPQSVVEASTDPTALLEGVLPGGGPLYISIDKDVLSPGYAATNWDQGDMALDHLLQVLSLCAGRYDIAGVDICGELPPSKGGHACSDRLNSAANAAIRSLLPSLGIQG